MSEISRDRFYEILIELKKEEKLDLDRRLAGESFYIYSYLYHRYLEEDSRFVDEIFPYIISCINNGSLIDIITNIYKKIKQYEIIQCSKYIERMSNYTEKDIMRSPEWGKRESYKKNLFILETQNIVKVFECERISNYDGYFNLQNNAEYLKENFIYFRCLELLYTSFLKQKNSLYSNNVEDINNLYLDKSINLKQVDEQFHKYGLVTLNDNMEFIISNKPRIFDKRIKKTIFLKNVSCRLASIFTDLIEKGLIKRISFRIDNCDIMENRFDQFFLLEELQFGKKFFFENLGKVSISKLYSENMADTLWILIDENNITFEEIIDDFNITDDEDIVTQVIHLQYGGDNGQYHIKHIDHEYIFYTVEEFEIRQNKYNQKGNGSKRLKSFKIDFSHIPFYLENGNFVLYNILDEYFINKSLLREYFEGILSS